MALIDDLRRLLQQSFPGARVKLTRFGDKVGGSLIWSGFDKELQIDRQTRLREVIDQLRHEQQLKVSFILTLTPAEHSSLSKAS